MARLDDPEPIHVVAGGRHVWARSVTGRVRRENQDAWCVVTSERSWWGPDAGAEGTGADRGALRGADLVVGVFDGLGGHPNGQAAARQAARALPGAVAGDASRKEVFGALDAEVRRTGGATTAVVAFIPAHSATGVARVLSVGDSAAYRLHRGGRLARVNQLDRSSRHQLTDCLGAGDAVGHEVEVPLAGGIVLVSDGVDGYIPFEEVGAALLQAPSDRVAAQFMQLFQQVDAAGARDNATALVVRL